MGPHNKLLQPIGGSTIIARVTGAAIASGACPVIVVTGFEADRIKETLRGLDVTFANNPNFDEGMSGSIKTGLARAAGGLRWRDDPARRHAGGRGKRPQTGDGGLRGEAARSAFRCATAGAAIPYCGARPILPR